jgi:enoyl-CoA hydratase/carnithine racemase
MYAQEALECGFVNKVVENQEAVLGKMKNKPDNWHYPNPWIIIIQ